MPSSIEVVCIGVSSSYCTYTLEVDISSSELCSVLSNFLEAGRGTILVTSSLRDFSTLYYCLIKRSLNILLLEVVPIFEAVVAGVDIDSLITHRRKLIELEYSSRRDTRIWTPPIPRRRLFSVDFWLSSYRQRYVVTPQVDRYKCIKGCSLCVEVCPYNALKGNPPVISSRCSGCTLCGQICPASAIYFNVFSEKYFEEVLDFAKKNMIDSIVIVCWESLEELEKRIAEIASERVLVVHTSCSFPPLLRYLVELFLNKLRVFIYCPRQSLDSECSYIVEFIEKMTMDLNKISSRVVIGYGDTLSSIKEIEPTTQDRYRGILGDRWIEVIYNLVELSDNNIAGREIELEVLPLYDISVLDPSKCVGCSAPCASSCPTSTLLVRDSELCFSRDNCIGCSKCVEVCPKTNIRIEKKLDNLHRMKILARLS